MPVRDFHYQGPLSRQLQGGYLVSAQAGQLFRDQKHADVGIPGGQFDSLTDFGLLTDHYALNARQPEAYLSVGAVGNHKVFHLR